MWQAPSYYIDDINNKFYVINYSEKKFRNIKEEKVWNVFTITKIYSKDNSLTVEVLDTSKQNILTFKFSKIEPNNIIYQLKTKGIKPSDITRYTIFTTEDYVDKFKKEGCGDFDG